MNKTKSENVDPFRHLLMLEESVRLNGAVLPKEIDSRVQWAGVKCHLDGDSVIIKMDDISEVLSAAQITEIPRCANWVVGVVNLRGRLLPVFNVTKYLETNTSSKNTKENVEIIVVDKGEVFCGIVVDKIFSMQKLFQKDFTSNLDEYEKLRSRLSSYFEADTSIDEKSWYQLNLELLSKTIFESSPALVEVSQ